MFYFQQKLFSHISDLASYFLIFSHTLYSKGPMMLISMDKIQPEIFCLLNFFVKKQRRGRIFVFVLLQVPSLKLIKEAPQRR